MRKIELTRERLIEIATMVYNAPRSSREKVAKQCGISYATLYRKLKEIDYEKERKITIK